MIKHGRDLPAKSWLAKSKPSTLTRLILALGFRVLSEHASYCDLCRVAVLTHLNRTGSLVATSHS